MCLPETAAANSALFLARGVFFLTAYKILKAHMSKVKACIQISIVYILTY